jgi:aerobic carbon-monoxide dehydrogenase medium subunit
MTTFRYLEPTDVGEAVALLVAADGEAHLLAGGTALVPLLTTGYVQPSLVIGMRRLPGLRRIERTGGALVIGGLATHAEIAASPLVQSGWPLLAAACASVGTVRIRNQATIGGNVVHADPNQDPPPALLVLDASARAQGPDGQRQVPLGELFVDVFETSLAPSEVLLDVTVPPVPPGSRTAYRKFLPRSQDDYATVAVAALVRLGSDGRVADARVALGGVGARPLRATAVEEALVGRHPTSAVLAAAAAVVESAIDPIADVRGSAGYKRAMARVWVERTLGELCDMAVA